VRHLPNEGATDPCGPMLVVHVVVDCRDAMGANAINTMCERLAPRIAELSGGRVGLRILTNLSDRRTVTVTGTVPFAALEGQGKDDPRKLAKAIEEASVFAERDPYRACTHNKGIMNGVDAVLVALGQDFRAVEAGAHAYAARSGRYTALATWRVTREGLTGRMEIPLAVGTVGGIVRVHPVVQVTRKILGAERADELARVAAAIGLAQNLAAIRALAAEGIQKGHMRMHARNVAAEAGATEAELELVAREISDRGDVSVRGGKLVLTELRERAMGGTARPAPTGVRPRPRTPAADPIVPSDALVASSDHARGSSGASASSFSEASLMEERSFGGKVLVTGAAGHLGANLVHRLVKEGRDVRVLLRQGSVNTAVDGLDIERVFGDLRDKDSVQRAVRGCETVFHVAARVSTTEATDAQKLEIWECNVMGTQNLLRSSLESGVSRVVVTGSLSAVGRDPRDPSRATDETAPFYPFEEHLPYGHTKVLVELETLRAVADGLDAVIATSCAILGPHDHKPSRMGRTLMDFANGKLSAYPPGGFEFVSAEDLVEGHLLALKRGRKGQKYTFSTQFMTVDDLMEIFEEVSGRPRPRIRIDPRVLGAMAEVSSAFNNTFRPSAPQRFTPAAVRLLTQQRHTDITKAKTELGYAPTSIRRAVHEAYADFARRGLVPARKSVLETLERESVERPRSDSATAG
jgi:nucleoside-diphosphate-sugar epimerase